LTGKRKKRRRKNHMITILLPCTQNQTPKAPAMLRDKKAERKKHNPQKRRSRNSKKYIHVKNNPDTETTILGDSRNETTTVKKERKRVRGSYHEQRIKGRDWGKLGKGNLKTCTRGMRNINRKSERIVIVTWLVLVGGSSGYRRVRLET
jgi:hypothetical protein